MNARESSTHRQGRQWTKTKHEALKDKRGDRNKLTAAILNPRSLNSSLSPCSTCVDGNWQCCSFISRSASLLTDGLRRCRCCHQQYICGARAFRVVLERIVRLFRARSCSSLFLRVQRAPARVVGDAYIALRARTPRPFPPSFRSRAARASLAARFVNSLRRARVRALQLASGGCLRAPRTRTCATAPQRLRCLSATGPRR